MGPDVDREGEDGLAGVFAWVWNWLTTSRYTRHLETEVERLREDRDLARRQIWALVNSLVTTAGAPLPQDILRQAATDSSSGAQNDKQSLHRGRKSWHQRALALEIETARELQNLFRGRIEAATKNKANGEASEPVKP
jgi:hypothetical protein